MLFSSLETPNLELLKQHSWKNYDQSRRKSGPSRKRLIFGDDVWIINQTSLMKFEIPSSFITSSCNIATRIKYLRNIKSSCIRDNGVNMEAFYRDIKILGAPHYFNASLYSHHFENCPKNVCIEIQPHLCGFDFTHCQQIYKDNITAPAPSEENSDYRIGKVWYKLYHNGTNGIVKANVFFSLENVTYMEKNVNYKQDFEVSFLWHNESTYNHSCIRSGNPGYLYGKPLLVANLVNEKISNSTSKLRIIRNSSEIVDNFLVLPKSRAGSCIFNNKSHEIVNFGYNIRLKCKMEIMLEKSRNQSAAELCKTIQRQVLNYWSISLNSTYERVVSIWGNGNITNIEDWKPISYNKKPEDMLAIVNGTWNDIQNRTVHCFNLTSDLWIDILHYRIDYDSLKNQEKILNVSYTFGKPFDAAFEYMIQAHSLIPKIDSVMNVMFYDVTGNKQRKYVEPPSLRFRLPYDFFYPFVKVDSSQAARKSGLFCLRVTMLFLFLCV